MKGKLFSHYKTHNVYRVKEELLLENPETKEWEDGVLYEEVYHYNPENPSQLLNVKDRKKFVRSKKRFNESFYEVILSKYILSETDLPTTSNNIKDEKDI